MSGLTRRRFLGAGARLAPASALLGLGISAGYGLGRSARPAAPGLPAPGGVSFLSLLAVGDTGRPSYGLGGLASGGSVARAVTWAHQRRPCDALLFLGDNFYPDGLARNTLAEQVRDCLAVPYRAFFHVSRTGAEQLGLDRECLSCNPVPVYGVLGNHDYHEPESPQLQTRVVPDLLPNWSLPRRLAELEELPGGVSLLRFQSVPWERGVADALAACMAQSRGPFRILAGHYPMADTGSSYHKAYTRELRELLGDSRVPVHLFLSGHEHSLQLLRMAPPAPPLHAIVGSGSYVRPLAPTRAERLFAADELGFARIERSVGTAGESLDVSLWTVPRWPRPGPPAARCRARARIGLAGDVRARTG